MVIQKTKKEKKYKFLKSKSFKLLSVLGIIVGITALAFPNIAQAQAAAIIDFVANPIDNTLGRAFEWFGWLVAWLFSFISFMGGQFMDAAIRYGVNGGNLRITGVIQGWTIFRNLVNMVFIFILLYAGIMTILQASSFNTKRVLINVIIVGLFINFSFFLTGFVIDVGNALSATLYNAVTPGDTEISGILYDRMNLSQLEDSAGGPDHFQKGIAYLMNAVFFSIAGFVFFSGGFLFIFRHISLLFVLMLSPLAFAALILPQARKHWTKWLNTLLANTFVAPAYMLMVVVTIGIASAPDLFSSGTPGNVSIGTGGEFDNPIFSTSGMLLNYIVIIGLMLGSLTVAKSISASLAGNATKWAGKVTGAGTGFAYRQTLGRKFANMRDSDKLAKQAAKGGMRGYAARRQMDLLNVGATSSGDMRGGMRALGVDAGKSGGQGGYDAYAKREAKRTEDLDKKMGDTSLKGKDYKEAEARAAGKEGIFDAKEELKRAKKTGNKAEIEAAENRLKNEKMLATGGHGEGIKFAGTFDRKDGNIQIKEKDENGNEVVRTIDLTKKLDREEIHEYARKAVRNDDGVLAREKLRADYKKKRNEALKARDLGGVAQARRDYQRSKEEQEKAKSARFEEGLSATKKRREDERLGTAERTTKRYYVDANGNRTLDKSKAVVEKPGAPKFAHKDGDRDVYEKEDGTFTYNENEAARGAPTYQQVEVRGYVDKKGGFTTDSSKAKRDDDGLQKEFRRNTKKNTIIGGLTGTAAIQRGAIEKAEKGKSDDDIIKELAKNRNIKLDDSDDSSTPKESTPPPPTPPPPPDQSKQDT